MVTLYGCGLEVVWLWFDDGFVIVRLLLHSGYCVIVGVGKFVVVDVAVVVNVVVGVVWL